jgi:hypothetical protein
VESPEAEAASPSQQVSSIELGNTSIARPQDITFGEGEDLTFNDMVPNSFDQWQEGQSVDLGKTFNSADADADGLITLDEAKVALKTASEHKDKGAEDCFRWVDADQDGKISQKEFELIISSGLQGRLREIKLRPDGRCTLDMLKKVLTVLGEEYDDVAYKKTCDKTGMVNYHAYRKRALEVAAA